MAQSALAPAPVLAADDDTAHRFVQIRRYSVPPDEVDEFLRRVQQGFVPVISSLPGFAGYYALDLGRGCLEFANIFETAEQAAASLETATHWVAQCLADLHALRTEVLTGRIRLSVSKG
jgi:hypothetical protein